MKARRHLITMLVVLLMSSICCGCKISNRAYYPQFYLDDLCISNRLDLFEQANQASSQLFEYALDGIIVLPSIKATGHGNDQNGEFTFWLNAYSSEPDLDILVSSVRISKDTITVFQAELNVDMEPVQKEGNTLFYSAVVTTMDNTQLKADGRSSYEMIVDVSIDGTQYTLVYHIISSETRGFVFPT